MPSQPSTSEASTENQSRTAYWKANLRIVFGILLVWVTISLGAGVLFRKFLDESLPSVGGAPFGFWMSQQGSIIGFLILLFVYMIAMNRLDRKFGFAKGVE